MFGKKRTKFEYSREQMTLDEAIRQVIDFTGKDGSVIVREVSKDIMDIDSPAEAIRTIDSFPGNECIAVYSTRTDDGNPFLFAFQKSAITGVQSLWHKEAKAFFAFEFCLGGMPHKKKRDVPYITVLLNGGIILSLPGVYDKIKLKGAAE